MQHRFKIIDLFSFSEPYEKEILLLKLQLGSPYIHEWVLVENDYTLQGVFKGYFAEQVLNSDDRFQPYRERIKIFKCSYRPEAEVIDDHYTFKVEFYQRDFPSDYLLSHHPDGYVIISDTDECPDLTEEKRLRELEEKIAYMEDIIELPTKRYWFDFDNEYKITMATPLQRISSIRDKDLPSSRARILHRRPITEKWKNFIVFEYSHCFDKEALLRKFETFTHTGFTRDDMELALACNHRPLLSVTGQQIRLNEKFLFDTIQLTPRNSPLLVRQQLTSLKTNIVDPEYASNRKKHYPTLFTPLKTARYQLKLLVKSILNRSVAR